MTKSWQFSRLWWFSAWANSLYLILRIIIWDVRVKIKPELVTFAHLLLRCREPHYSPHTASKCHQQRKQPCHWRALSARTLRTCSWYASGEGTEIGSLWSLVKDNQQFAGLKSLIESVFCTPCTSAPVERVLSHGVPSSLMHQGCPTICCVIWWWQSVTGSDCINNDRDGDGELCNKEFSFNVCVVTCLALFCLLLWVSLN